MNLSLKSVAGATLIVLSLAVQPSWADGGGGSNSGGGGNGGGEQTAGLSKAQADVDAGRYDAALKKLDALAKSEPGNADVWNLLGFSSRKLGKFDAAAGYYEKALALDARHLGALEYQGELFIETGQVQKALANLERLNSLCGTCEQFVDLKEALAEAGQS